ncbi:ECF transporter S component [Gephyromycinifex aptenodytis]|uniref:ECF transporter S component n=1 Tax=Gephyromycinifex aptenodytis TaxID=2716227 RepID=UPI0014455B62|nr:ECF transporter S component [Gephyromycinifex aptenodytis]
MSQQFAHPTAGRHTALAKHGPFAWRALDLITLAVLGVALGVAFWGFDTFLYYPLKALLAGFPPAQQLMLGIWILPAVAGMLLVRRPGAALLCEMVAASVEMLLGTEWASLVLLAGLLQAMGVEVVAALWRWRRFDLMLAVLGGVLGAVFQIVLYQWWFAAREFSWAWKLIYLAAGMISGAVIAGLGGRALIRALAATGAVNAFPPGEEHLIATGELTTDMVPVGEKE